ncbi:MAG: HWE histidine kinase domain-containing protein [Sphingomicrobium sp.]
MRALPTITGWPTMNDVQRPEVDLTNCDREPIHELGAIQPIGFLIALTSDWLVSRVSANIDQFLDLAADDIIGQPVTEVLSDDAIHSLRNRLALLRGVEGVERVFGLTLDERGQKFDAAVHFSGPWVIIEAEPNTEHNYGDVTGTVRGMLGRLDGTADEAAFFNEGARQIRALSGFDRVMVYRFDADGSGEVIAESAKSGIGSFLGLHYPASDIPRQARELYKRNLLRVITDIEAVPVPIVPALDEHGKPLDLSLSVLRSVSPIHIEYLRNMGVRASMSISLIVGGELWGLVACHHHAPRCPSFERRSVAELFAQLFSMRIESRERQKIVDYERRARDISDQLLGAVASDDTLLKDPEWLSQILTSAIPAEGVGVWINGDHAFSGSTPSTGSFARIVQTLNRAAAGKVYATDNIAGLVPDFDFDQEGSAGMLAIPISRSPRDYVILFRDERVRSVKWAGDPNKPVEYGPNGPRLSPRQSFETWKETVAGRSLAFTPSEVRVAETLRATLIEVVLRLADEASAERQEASERQELLIAELNHRVRNILSLIRGLIRQSIPPSGAKLEDFVALIDGRIHALARAHNQITQDHWNPAPLKSLIDAEAAVFLHGREERIRTDGELVLLKPQAYSALALVIHELVTNSVKYGALSGGGTVDVEWTLGEDGDLILDWAESGGPKVEPPTRKGFGSSIIDHSVPYDLGGKAATDYPAEGFRANFVIPARHIADLAYYRGKPIHLPTAALHSPVIADGTLLKGRKVLLVEDSLIIALDAEDILRRLGARDVVAEANVSGAIAAIGPNGIDFAILDINLGDQVSYPAADELDEQGVPFLFATGYGEQAQLPERHRGRMVLQKPYTLNSVARAVARLLGAEEMAATTDA